jgi:hypothetical protein
VNVNRTACQSLVLGVAWLVAGCSPAGPLGIHWPGPPAKSIGESGVESVTGVVNGLWQCDTEQNSKRLAGMFVRATPTEIPSLANRCQVRVGIDKAVVGESREIVVLPEAWRYSLDAVIDDGRTVNLGDVVVVTRHAESRLSSLDRIERKCSAPAAPTENKDWNIGCKSAERFDSRGYAGERYFWLGF